MASTIQQQHHIKALTPTWLLVKVSTAPPRDGFKPAAAAYSPLLLSPSSVWQKAQDEKKKKKKKKKSQDLPASPRISCMGQVKGRRMRRKGCPTSACSPRPARGSSGHGCVLATLLLGLFGRRNGRTSKSKVRDVPRGGGGSASAPGSPRGVVAVTVAVLDPPLPVVRRPARSDDAPNLWERRRGGKALEGLRLPYIGTESS